MPSSKDDTLQIFSQLVKEYVKQSILHCDPLAPSGSHRQYYRITLEDNSTLIGAYNDDVAENQAFFTYTRFFTDQHFHVPQLLAIAPDNRHYLQSDVGRHTLYDLLTEQRNGDNLSADVVRYYEQAVRALPALQLSGKQGLDFSVAYPRSAFDRQSMQWDLNYFKYYFLKLADIPFNEQLLENDYNTLIDYLLTTDGDFFLYRDFQSRNLMIQADTVYFIDYQGGRKGALQYDIASLLYDAKADLTPAFRDHLLSLYIEQLSQYIAVDRALFLSYFQGFVLIRILQSMGAYGYRGYFERKTHFLQSVPYALRNLEQLLDHMQLPIEIPELTRVLRGLCKSDIARPYHPEKRLTVRVQSFSYKKSIPQDPSPNGGGFVFDCRALPNPGREKQYHTFTGKDDCVRNYLNQYPVVHQFKEHLYALIDLTIDNYLERQFKHLMVSCGCTGGQHRSVFFAEEVAAHIRQKYPMVRVVLIHLELEQ